ncbi:MAG TPA: hypothetical protein VHB93_00635 [Candidatus Paceibacterota bacterium]|nr:hypothetical protein [Candidatus Paceibacterota bacterium]
MPDARHEWEQYRIDELARATRVLVRRGFVLDDVQPHTQGERFLLSGHKLVLLGIKGGTRCIIKVSSEELGKKELRYEHECRHTLHNLDFAYRPFFSPDEIAYFEEDGVLVLVTSFIEEEKGFLAHTLAEQFFLALGAFKTQEGVQATTYRHAQTIKDVFGIADAESYLTDFTEYAEAVHSANNTEASAAMREADAFLREHRVNIDRYMGFLTHTDFVPHNLRIGSGYIYLLDHTSLRFGNKYESWGRFINYMTLYNPALESALVEYVRRNRSSEEYEALRLMRVYKLGFLIAFYARNAVKTSGDVQELARIRIAFWAKALQAVLADTQLSSEAIDAYKHERDRLRSDEEKDRQKLLNQL